MRYPLNIIIILFAICFLTIQCSNDSTEPEEKESQKTIDVLVLGDDGTEDSLIAVLSAAGYDVDYAGPYYDYDGNSIEKYKVVIFLNGVEWVEVMSDTTQQIIRDYVATGGVLFSIEWISWSGATNQIINNILPITYGGWWSTGSEYYYKMTDHPISEALPDTFLVPANWSYSNVVVDMAPEKSAQVIFQGSQSGAAIVVGDHGEGKTIHWNMGGHYAGSNIWDEDVKTLFSNCVSFGRSVAK
jgi:hypothetical protein